MTTGPAPADGALTRYRALLALPGVLAPLVATTLGRMALGMTGLALLLLVEARRDSYADAGLVAGAYAVSLAVAVPLRARVVDRRGQTAVLVSSAVVHPLALLAAVAAVVTARPLPLVAALVALAGAANPPLGSVMRALWAALTPDKATLLTAYTFEAVLTELAFIAGPLAVAGIVLAAGPSDGAAVAVVVAAVVAGVGSAALAATPASRSWVPHADRATSVAGPLRSVAVRRLLAVAVAVGFSFGAVEVAVPAFAEAHGTPALGGVLLAVWSLGSVLGGLAYGAVRPTAPAERQYGVLVAGLAVAAALPALAPGPGVLAALLLVYGASIAPLFAVQSVLIDRAAPPGTLTEAFAWVTTGIFSGAAAGNALAGQSVHGLGPRAGLLLGAAGGALALVAGAGSRRALRPA